MHRDKRDNCRSTQETQRLGFYEQAKQNKKHDKKLPLVRVRVSQTVQLLGQKVNSKKTEP